MTTSGAHVCRVDNFYDVGNTCLCQSGVEGFGRPLSDDGVWVFAHALFQTMTENKTKYLRNLESLQAAYSNCYGDCVGDIKVLKLSLLIAMFESADMFEKISDDLAKNFIIDIDRDVDYKKMSTPKTWYDLKTNNGNAERSGTVLSFSTMDEKVKNTLAYRIAGMLPPEPETATHQAKNTKQTEELNYSEREEFKRTINNLMNDNIFGTIYLDYAIEKTLQRLCAALLAIHNTIKKKPTKAYLEALFSTMWFHYNNKISELTKDAYEEWKEHLIEDELTEGMLHNHVTVSVVKLLATGVFNEVVAPEELTDEKEALYKKEINFDRYDISQIKRPYDLYSIFRSIYNPKHGKYSVDKVKAGRFLFHNRKNFDKLEAFFTFHQTLTLAYNDIKELRGVKEVGSVYEDIDFSKLECIFTPEQVEESDIKQFPEIVLALIDKMVTEETPKAYWVTFYCVLLEKKLIENNVRKFCKNMNSIFTIGLDHSGMNRDIKKLGEDIEQWDDSDPRSKDKKEFGLKFKSYIEHYREYRHYLNTIDLV